MARVYLTNGSVDALRAQATNAGKVFTDDRLKGFLFKVGTDGGGTFYLQREVGKRAVRVALGKLGAVKPDNKPMTVTDFRALAEEVRGELTRANKAAATNPAEATRIVSEVRSRLDEAGAPKRPTARAEAFRDDDAQAPGPRPDDAWETFTVQQAMEEHFRNMRTKGRDRSVPQARDEAKRYLGDWLPLPIAGIRRRDCIDQHRRICENHGNPVANKSFRLFRAFWYSAAARFDVDDERANPVRRMPWAPEKQGQPIPWAALPAWAAQVNGMTNPVRRDWYWFVLLTALRNGDARRVRWEELNLTDRPKRYVNAQGEKVELEPFSTG
ncbi:hypothetical protein J4558_15645 [Leptolyngbya sp. 15MV]|nr:hypothetical protein J4558_15645 [Leptolyngbya sp. 15MV]